MRRVWPILLASVALAGCPKKNEGAAGATSAASSASAPAASDSAAAAASAVATAAADTAEAPPAPPPPHAVSPGAPPNPNAGVAHEDHDNSAKADITKASYKKHLDDLEKEDLTADKK